MHTPGHVAAQLQIDASTLRRWARQFRTYLSPAAGSGNQRRYTDADLATLHQIKGLLDEGHTVAQVQQRLGLSEEVPDGHPAGTVLETPGTRNEEAGTQVVLLNEHRPELDALRRLIEQQRQLLDQQEQHIADQAALLVQHQHTLDSREHEIERARSEADRERARTERVQSELERARVELERARTEHAELLADVRAMLTRLPRWVKRWWGLA